MSELSNYPRSHLANLRRVSAIKRIRLCFVAFTILNVIYAFPPGCWYFFTEYILGELESPFEGYLRLGLYAAAINFALLTIPWIVLYRLKDRSALLGIVASFVTALLSVGCLGWLALGIGWRLSKKLLDAETELLQLMDPKYS